ncbi:A24 family peptidase [Nocardioides sp.]|uniref:A24 family peptidase n=1 Tax=Nocardioides sp. TaxID=35761 RepID=UPI002ED890EB
MAAALGAGGLAAGVLLRAWLALRRYRYDDEVHLPPRRVWWVVPVLGVGEAVLGWRLADAPAVLATFALALVWMTGLAAIDLDVRRLPDRWTLPAYPAGLLLLAGCAWAEGQWGSWGSALACAVGSGVVYLVLSMLNPAGLGLGDVKLAGVLGMLTGWFGWAAAFAAFFLAFVLGGLVGVVVAVRTGAGRKATFPFGPAMLAAAYLVVLAAG